jgi:outer membrane protein OmpA-like peptidoglycan-associated protein
MHYKPVLLLLLFLKAMPLFALQRDTVKIFYGINKYRLSAADQSKLKELAITLNNIDTLKVAGYADYLGNTDYNVVLSGRRAEAVKQYMLSLNNKLLILTEAKGQVPAGKATSSAGEPNNRRVDIIKIRSAAKPVLTLETPNTKRAVIKPDSAPHKIPGKGIVITNTEDTRPFKERLNDLSTLNIGSSLSVAELTFQPGRHYLNRESVYYLNALLGYLKDHNNIVFEIQGHICCVYNDGDSFDIDTRDARLSTNRAKFIYDYFLNNGISSDRMTYKGLDSTKPKVWPETSEHDRYLNRRVDILVVNK